MLLYPDGSKTGIAESAELKPLDKRKINFMTFFTTIQCIAVWIGTGTVIACVWSPDNVQGDLNKLMRIMYLYDYNNCRYSKKPISITNLLLNNETEGYDVEPIAWTPAVLTMSARLAENAIKHVVVSSADHFAWVLLALLMCCFCNAKSANQKCVKFFITCYFYFSILIVLSDIIWSIIYIAHLKQALTYGMILRHSGWSVEIKLENRNAFGGWIPMAAAACWLRGGVIFALNVYYLRLINHIRIRIKKREVRIKLAQEGNLPFPDPRSSILECDDVLYIRAP